MKTPAEYLAAAHHPEATPGPLVSQAQAERAIQAAQLDKDKYYGLLLRAIRNAKQP